MFIKVRLSSVLLIVAALMLVFASCTSLASGQSGAETGFPGIQSQSVPDSGINYLVPGGPGFVSIPGMTFTPADYNIEWETYYGLLTNPGTRDGYYFAQVSLPQGAIVNQVVGIFYDAALQQNLRVWLYRKTAGSPEILTMAEVNSTGDIEWSYMVDDTISYATIENQEYSYVAVVLIPYGEGSNLGFDTLRVDYEYPGYLPLMTK